VWRAFQKHDRKEGTFIQHVNSQLNGGEKVVAVGLEPMCGLILTRLLNRFLKCSVRLLHKGKSHYQLRP
jgi:hypothetical protein